MSSILPHFPKKLSAEISLPTSKSLCARALVVNQLCDTPTKLVGLSDCDDTKAILHGLSLFQNPSTTPQIVDIGAAGTAMRFLTALFAATPKREILLTGSQRMQERPIGVLIDALRQLGASINYVEKEGFPPLRIRGKQLEGGTISLPASISSQYISALLMIAPTMSYGLTLRLEGKVASAPYIHMTLQVMKAFGLESSWEGDTIFIAAGQRYARETIYRIEGDWSAASYWYEIVALHPDSSAKVLLRGLTENSWQGDAVCAKWFAALGVQTTFTEEGAILEKSPSSPKATSETDVETTSETDAENSDTRSALHLDFSAAPDLAQTFVVTCAMLSRSFHFTGLESLRIKETDRIAALQTELKKLGKNLEVVGDDTIIYSSKQDESQTETSAAGAIVEISTYDDHRMALAFAPAALLFPRLSIAHPEVVAKSYPNFWEHLAALRQTRYTSPSTQKVL